MGSSVVSHDTGLLGFIGTFLICLGVRSFASAGLERAGNIAELGHCVHRERLASMMAATIRIVST